MEDTPREEISRREALKRGAKIGVGVLWATPAVQAVSMVRSAAAATSPPPDEPVYYGVKVEEGVCEDIWDQIGRDTSDGAPTGHCLTPNKGDLAVIPGGCGKVTIISTDEDENWVIELAEGCEIVADECLILTKAGTECLKDPAFRRDGQRYYFFNPASNGKGISHVEFVICCRQRD